MKLLSFLFILLMVSCSKSDDTGGDDCNLTGEWRQVVSFPGEPEAYGGTMVLEKNGEMKFLGFTGYQWKVTKDCSTFIYWGKGNKDITVEMKILSFDGEYLSLELLTGALAQDPFGLFDSIDFKREK